MVKKRISKSNVRPNTTECRSVFKKKYNRLALSFMSILLLGGVTNAHAETTCVDITAQVSRVDDDSALLHDSIKPGDIITGKYVYDLATPNTSQESGATGGAYMHNTAPYGITLNVGEFVFRTNPDKVSFYMGIGNDHEVTTEERTYLEDGFGIISYNNIFDISTPDQKNILTSQDYYARLLIGFWLVDDSASAISNIDLPKQPPTLEDWPTTNQLDISYDYPSTEGRFLVRAKVNSAKLCESTPAAHNYLSMSPECATCHGREKPIEVHREACGTCHKSTQPDVVAAIAAGRAQKTVTCTTCHNGAPTGVGLHPGYSHPYLETSKDCANCHSQKPLEIHAKQSCIACHASEQPDVVAAIAASRAQKTVTCTTCHNGAPTGVKTHKTPTPKVRFSLASQSVSENVGTVTVTAKLSDPPNSRTNVKVPFLVTGTAKGGGVDHNLSSGSIVIPAGEPGGSVSFKVTNDALYEENETVVISMGKPTNADKGDVTVHTVTIKDDDKKPLASFKNIAQTVSESVGNVNVTAVLPQAAGVNVSVPYTVSGTATGGGVDHNLSNGSITIPAGQTSGVITFKVINDELYEEKETVVIKMKEAANRKGSHTVIIKDDDKKNPSKK